MMRKLIAYAAIALIAAASMALAQDDGARQAALAREAAPAPGLAFPELTQVAMSEICVPGAPPRFYPPEALQRRRGGNVVLDCALGADGKPTSCYILYEEPARMQFGEASLHIACRFVTQPPSPDSADAASGNLPANSRVYRRDGDGELRRARVPVVFRIGSR